MPETRARISTSREPSAWPTASSVMGTTFVATWITVTGMGGGAAPAAPAFASPPLPQAASRMAEMAIAATAACGKRRVMGKDSWIGRGSRRGMSAIIHTGENVYWRQHAQDQGGRGENARDDRVGGARLLRAARPRAIHHG